MVIDKLRSLLGHKSDSELKAMIPDADVTLMPNILHPFGIYLSPSRFLMIAFSLCISMSVIILLTITHLFSQIDTTPALHLNRMNTLKITPGIWHEIFILLIYFSMVITPVLASRQWRGYEKLIPHMRASGALATVGPRGPNAVAEEVLSANRWIYNSRVLRFPILLMSVLTAWLVLESQNSMGLQIEKIDSQLFGFHISDWTMTDSPIAWILYMSAGIAGIYVVTLQNVVGCRIIIAIYRIRKRTQFAVDLLNHDRSWGWQPVRTILGATYAEIVIHGLGLFALTLTISRSSSIYLFAIIPAIEWVITVPIYAVVPMWIIASGMKKYRWREYERMNVVASSRNDCSQYPIDIARRIDRLNEIPRVPFLGLPEKTLFIVAQVANFSACYGVIVALLSGWRMN